MHDVDRSGGCDALGANRPLDLAVGDDSIDRGLASGAIHLQIAHHHQPLPVHLHEYKRIGSDESCGIVQIRVGFAGGNHEQRAVIGHNVLLDGLFVGW